MSRGPIAVEGKSERTKAREAFFLDFAAAIRDQFPDVPLVVTGGFRTRQGMESAVRDGGCDAVGVGRPAVLNPSLPLNTVFNKEIDDASAKLYAKKIESPWFLQKIGLKNVGAGIEIVSSQLPRNTTSRTRLTAFVVVVLKGHGRYRPYEGIFVDFGW